MTLISDEYSLDELLLLIDMCRILNSQQTVTEHAQAPASLRYLFNYFHYFIVYDLIN